MYSINFRFIVADKSDVFVAMKMSDVCYYASLFDKCATGGVLNERQREKMREFKRVLDEARTNYRSYTHPQRYIDFDDLPY